MSQKQSQKGQVHLENIVITDCAHPDCSQRMEFAVSFPLYKQQSWPVNKKKNALVSELDQFERL